MTSQQDTKPRFRFASAGDIHRIVELDRRFLPDDTIVSEAVFSAWRRKNPEVFTCLLADRRVCGYYAVLPLAAAALERFVGGTLIEKDFAAEDILGADASPVHCGSLYFYSIVLDTARRPLLGDMLRQFAMQIENYRRKQPLHHVYATAATSAGRRLLERLGFNWLAAADGRADGHDLYALDGSAVGRLSESIAAMVPRQPDQPTEL